MRITVSNDQLKHVQQEQGELRATGIHRGEIGSFQEGQIIKAKIKSILNEIILLELGNGKTIEAKHNNTLAHGLEKGGVYQFVVKSGEDGQILIKPLLQEGMDVQQDDQGIVKFLAKAGIAPEKDKIQLVKLLLDAEMPVNEKLITEVAKTRLQFDRIDELLREAQNIGKSQFLEKDLGQVLKALMKNQELQGRDREQSIQIDSKDNLKNAFLGTIEPVSNGGKIENDTQGNLLSKMAKTMGVGLEENIDRINIKEMDFDKIIFLLKNGLKINLKNATALNDIILRQFPLAKQFEEIVENLSKDQKTMTLGKSLSETLSKMQDALMNGKSEFTEALKDLYTKAEMVKLKLMSFESEQNKDIVKQLENFKNSIDFLGKINPLQTFLQVPLEMGNGHRNLDLFVIQERGKSKKINPQDVKILVSLDTRNMEFVQALIEIKEKSITCNFRTVNEHAQQLIQTHQKKLEQGLEKYGFTSIYFHYAITQSEMHLMNSLRREKTKNHHSIDLKV